MSKDFKSIYFVGAGGIGMAALERYFLDNGKQVAGYDRTATDLTRALEKEGVEISYVEDPDTIPAATSATLWWCTRPPYTRASPY